MDSDTGMLVELDMEPGERQAILAVLRTWWLSRSLPEISKDVIASELESEHGQHPCEQRF